MKKTYDIGPKEIKEFLAEDASTEPVLPEIKLTEDAFLLFAKAHSASPPSFLREKVLGKINQLELQKKGNQKLDLEKLPMLDHSTNWAQWQAVVEGIEPPSDFDNIYLHTLESNEKRDLFVAWVKQMVDEEVHSDILESFMLLEGSCECHITNEMGETRIVRMGQGDQISIQLGETHDIVVTSLQPAKAILEWRKLAA